MSLPNYLAKIKSAGIYRFTWDKSVVPPQQAETLRLVVGYSEKGPFNTPVYVESVADFKSIYGNISKKLERKGSYFHRMAEQALQAGPILAMNIKPFNKHLDSNGNVIPETVNYINFNAHNLPGEDDIQHVEIKDLYDTNRFWKLDEDKMVENIGGLGKYITISATDTKETSCTIFIRKVIPSSYENITFRQWYNSQGLEYPDYMEDILDTDMSDYFGEIYVFRGKFTESICKNGPLSKYFDVDSEGTVTLKTNEDFRKNHPNKKADVLDELASNSNSNFISSYTGATLPYFKDANGNYISLDIKFNSDHSKHKLMMKLDESMLIEPGENDDIKNMLIIENHIAVTYYDENDNILSVEDIANGVTATYTEYTESPIQHVYLEGYTYNSINYKGETLWNQCKPVLEYVGVRDALTNRVDVEYHYIIDAFDTDVDETKSELFQLAKEKDNTFAIVNFPKMSKFVNWDSAVEDNTGAFDMEETMKKYALPGESEGASYGAYYTQLTFSDGTVKFVVPAAALVSNNFMQKWGPRQPYYIVAGPNYGALSYSGLIGPDYNFSRSDLDVLEPKGVNAIIYVPRLGTYISSNQTAKQIPVSALSKIHIRELVIYLQNEVEHVLQSYQWELNTQPLRDVIKAKADAICDRIYNNGGIYAYVNICDETNNTPEVIDNEMIILDTEIEPARGAGKMVHQLTIHKTGGMTSSVK